MISESLDLKCNSAKSLWENLSGQTCGVNTAGTLISSHWRSRFR